MLTVADKDKPDLLPIAQRLKKLGFNIYATEGTACFLKEKRISARPIKKLHEGRPNIADAIQNKDIQLIINTPVGRSSQHDDSYIRIKAIQQKIPYITTMAAAEASISGIEAIRKKSVMPKALQEYHEEVRNDRSGRVAAAASC